MKILIAYSSKNGTAKECAERLQAALHQLSADLVDLDHQTPQILDYDIVLLGGSVYFGKLRPALRRYMRENAALLMQKSFGFFLCCGLAHDADYYREKLFPPELNNLAFAHIYFGGRLKIEGASRMDRFFLHSMRSTILEEEMDDGEYTLSLPAILPENIERMATLTREEYLRLSTKK